MKKTKLLFMFASSAMLLGLLSVHFFNKTEYIGKDNAVYSDDPLVVDYEKPAYTKASAASVSATSISVHYHNDDGKNSTREFWVWCDGVNGSAFAPKSISSDGKDMELSFSFTGEHANFAKKKGIYFIVKFKSGWVGQSDNMYVEYSEFPPDESGKTEVWCIPGEGSAIEMYKSQQETKMDRFVVSTFSDWKTINVRMTAVPASWKLYAFTSSYMSYGETESKLKKENFLIAQGSNPTCTDYVEKDEDNKVIATYKQFDIKLNYTAKVNVQYCLEGVFPNWSQYTKTKYVSSHKLYNTARFEQYYTYSGKDLGATYSAEGTTFKVWAPTAARVRVLLYDSGTNEELAEELGIEGSDFVRGYNMVFQPGGIWQVTIKGDLNGKYYTYYVVNSLGTSEACDPYAKACGVNGDRAMICDFSKTNPEGWSNLPLKWDGVTGYDIKTPNELSVYEVHIRDLTMDSSWNGKELPGTFSAFVERGTKVKGTEVTTGFDHLEEMGFKAIQLVPVFDNDNLEQLGKRSYNWGYNPLNYNCVDGSYATDPYDGASRIKEFKDLVLAFANNINKTRIIMDVVYNHVSSAPASCFNKLMPRYYFRMEEKSGNYFDGSGCGNEVRSEATMMRKYIVESLCWWASEYKIKGFRFDLMGLIDVGTIDLARKELYKIDPDIVIYGEGWTGDGSGYDYGAETVYAVHGHGDLNDNGGSATLTTEQKNLMGCVTKAIYRYLNPQPNTCYVGGFNDAGRNAIRGDNNLDNGWGFIDQGSEHVGNKSKTVADMMVGYHTGMGGNPNQCVNYASCHDNYSLFDQLMNGISGATWTDPGLACAAVSAVECAIMFSNGIAFMQGGEEVFRSKEVKSAADKELVKASDSHTIKGHLITHNAYNLSDDVNAFRWERKIAIGSTSTIGYVQEMAKAIKLRNTLAKYDYDYLNKVVNDVKVNDPYVSTSKFNVWNFGDGSTSIGIKNDHYFCFIAGVDPAVTPFDPTLIQRVEFTSNKTSTYNGYTKVDGGIQLGWYTTVCFYC